MLGLLLPERCAVCGRVGSTLCGACLIRLVRLREPVCARCGSPGPWPVARCAECAGRRLAFATARAALVYDDAARRLVASWKEHGLRRLAATAAALVVEVVPRPAVAALVAVPADAERARRRGHRPAEALTAELGRRWELPVVAPLARARVVGRQRGLRLAERRRNVAGAFAAAGVAPARVCLVDDVYTSGATANAAASALRRAGARRVEVVTLARAVR